MHLGPLQVFDFVGNLIGLIHIQRRCTWLRYDREEDSTIDADSSSVFLGDEASFKKKEAELAKRLVRRDGTKMTLAQSKKLSQLTDDNAQWEDQQLLRSGAVEELSCRPSVMMRMNGRYKTPFSRREDCFYQAS